VRLRLARLGIDAPISAVGIDLQHGVLAIPADIHRLGWWRDSRTPSASSGSMLLAGHVDNAKARIGALFDLHEARVGDRIEVRTANRATHAYSVTSIRTYPKNQLPLDVYSRAGGARLVLVTCGGVFDKVSGHYPDNIVVTAAPVDPAS
jgi:sortase (surface protein transpeptidase)